MTENISNIAENVKRVQDEIAEACIKYGRNPADVTLMGVSKTYGPAHVKRAYEAGIRLFGENRVQELQQKSEMFSLCGAPCHIIGRLQTNKVKYLPALTDTIQSVDSIKLAKEIEKQYGKAGKTANVCLEINIGMEESKGGIPYDGALEFAMQVAELKNITVKGLMCVPPICEGERVRNYFSQMHKLFVDIRAKKIDNIDMCILSMGMSQDYKWAIAEGSNLVRVGTAIFGARNYGPAK